MHHFMKGSLRNKLQLRYNITSSVSLLLVALLGMVILSHSFFLQNAAYVVECRHSRIAFSCSLV